MEKTRKQKKRSRIRRILLIMLTVIFVIDSAVVSAVLFYLNKINRVTENVVTIPPSEEDFETDDNPGLEEIDPDTVKWDASGPLGDEDLINILLVGQDKRPGETRQRSDAMIVCSVNKDTGKVALISFLRDLYVQIPGYTDNRLNAAYAFGGFGLLTSTLYKNFGITIDGSFEVDFTAFRALIDKIGGVDITLTADEAKIVGRGTTEGVNHLDGHGALTYARIRKIGTDFARTSRQRTVLMAVYGKVKGMQLTEIISLINESLPYLTTDMSNGDIISLATKLFPLITKAQINSYYVPPDGMYENKYIRSMAILYPNLAAIKQILRNEYLPLSVNADIATQ